MSAALELGQLASLIDVNTSTNTIHFSSNVKLTSVVANNSLGANGQVLTTNGTIVYWANSTGGGGTVSFYANGTPPSNVVAGTTWFDTDVGVLYTYVTDSDSSQWVELGPYPVVTPIGFNLDGGFPDSNYGGISIIDAGGVS